MTGTAFQNKLTLRFSGIDSDNAFLLEEALKAYEGMQFVQVKLSRSLIRFHYDVQLTNLEELLDLLAEFQVCKYDQGLWWQWRWRLAFQLERNIQENAAHVPHCCGKAPTSVRRR